MSLSTRTLEVLWISCWRDHSKDPCHFCTLEKKNMTSYRDRSDKFETNHSRSSNLNSLEISLMQSWKAVPSLEHLFHKYVFILSLSLSLAPRFSLGHFPVQPQWSQGIFYAIYVYFKVLFFLPLHCKTSQSNLHRWSHSYELVIYLSLLAEKLHRYFNVISNSAGLKT